MHSTMYAKVEKAVRYSNEKDRIAFNDFQVSVKGDHRSHSVTYSHGTWNCDCETFEQADFCSHTMAIERILGDMVTPTVPATAPAAAMA